ncbi:CD48 antigen [Oryzias melastigma]|uniref:CD48 antigen n=1 Tax=Oryzias melastigma TaxID=30732 RepID=A0A834FRU9_ORYME|nr:CD48 antigen [Oryzias melastigma]
MSTDLPVRTQKHHEEDLRSEGSPETCWLQRGFGDSLGLYCHLLESLWFCRTNSRTSLMIQRPAGSKEGLDSLGLYCHLLESLWFCRTNSRTSLMIQVEILSAVWRMRRRMKLEVLVFTVMLLAASEGLKTILKVVGGNVTLPDPVPESGFLLRESKNIAQVLEKKLNIFEEIYRNKILWDQTSGLFTITDLQKSDSGVYHIDSKTGKVFNVFYNLTVFDSPAPPAVRSLNSSSDSCWLLCSVDSLSSLSWFRGPEELERRDSVLSLRVSISREEQNSSFRCESSNPAGETSVTVDVETLCSPSVEQEAADGILLYWVSVVSTLIGGSVVLWIVASTMQSDEESVESSSSDLLTRVRFMKASEPGS